MSSCSVSVDPFRSVSARRTTSIGDAAITLSRVNEPIPADGLRLTAPSQDAFGLIFQMGQLPEHDFWSDGKHQRVAAGPPSSLSIIDLNAGVESLIPAPFDSLGLCIPRAALDAFTQEASLSRIGTLSVPEMWVTCDSTIASLARPLMTALDKGDAVNPLFADHLVLALLSHVTDNYGGAPQRPKSRTGGLAPWQERRAKELLDGAGAVMALADIARHCELSVAHFSRAFKRSTGVAPYIWLQRQRVERAKTLLSGATMPIAQIAIACGFGDQSHFTKAFARVVGATPAAWRRQRSGH